MGIHVNSVPVTHGITHADHFSPSLGPGLTPKLPPPPSSTVNSNPSAPVGPGLPPPPQPSSSHAPYPPAPEGALVPLGAGSGSFPDDLDPHNVPPELKKEGSDWFAIFNPKVKRVLDVSLVHTLMHERYVAPYMACVGIFRS